MQRHTTCVTEDRESSDRFSFGERIARQSDEAFGGLIVLGLTVDQSWTSQVSLRSSSTSALTGLVRLALLSTLARSWTSHR